VLLLDKSLIGKSGATVAASGIAATGPWSVDGDSAAIHFDDTVVGGKSLNNQRLVRILVEDVSKRVMQLEENGLYFDKEPDGKYVLDVGGGHTFRRLLAVSDRVGQQIIKVLWKRMLQLGVEYRPYVLTTRVLSHNGTAEGATALDFRSGAFLAIAAKAVVLTTGGIGQLYPVTTNPRNSTGDGLHLALEAGARLINMEQVQFYPACVVNPEPIRGFGLGILEYGKLLNSKMERFMARYQPGRFEATTRDILSRSIFGELSEGRATSHGGVYLDAREVPENNFRSYLHEYETCLLWGIDLHHDLIEVAPGAHYFMGGVEIDERCQTSIDGLFAAGEVSAGIHGANRLNGNSLADVVVFGAMAGEQAAAYASRSKLAHLQGNQKEQESIRISRLLNRPEGMTRPLSLQEKLRGIMRQSVNVARTVQGLKEAVAKLEDLRVQELPHSSIEFPEIRWNNELRDFLELEAMVTVAECIIRSAFSRHESRGAHFIADFPEQDDAHWLKNTTVVKHENELMLSTEPVAGLEEQPAR
jgi:succinate dehydrogenase/fumarate reductase flavoprotein subunit